MNRQTIIFIVLVALVGFFVYQSQNTADENNNPLKITDERMDLAEDTTDIDTESSAGSSDNEAMVTSDDAMEQEQKNDGPIVQNIENQTFVPYTNRAVGYTIERPDNWYWQHFFVTELEAFPSINDILVIDRVPLPDIVSIYNTAIVIDVKTGEVSAPTGSKTDVQINGKNAFRYEHSTENTLIIIYHIPITTDTTLRMIYSGMTDDTAQKTVFEHIVQSLTF